MKPEDITKSPEPTGPKPSKTLSRREFVTVVGGVGIGAILGGMFVSSVLLPGQGVSRSPLRRATCSSTPRSAPAARAACWRAR